MTEPKKKKQTKKNAEIIELEAVRNSPHYCDHQWSFVSRDESKDTCDWKCNRCNDVGFTRGPLPKKDWEGV